MSKVSWKHDTVLIPIPYKIQECWNFENRST